MEKHFRSRSSVDLLHELNFAGPASLMSWPKHWLGHGLSEEGGNTQSEYHTCHVFVTCVPLLHEKCNFSTVVVIVTALGPISRSILAE